MSTHEGRHPLSRLSVVLAAALSCGVVCAAAVGALTAPVVVTVIVLAMGIGALSVHEHEVSHRADPWSVSSRPVVAVVRVDAPRAGQAAPRSDVA